MDPERSTQAAIAYLKVLHGLFGDWTTALAAYNCGEGNVLRAIRQQHVNYLDDFWHLYPRLPLETARYVPRFLAALHIIKDPEKYGFDDLELDQPLISEQVQVNRQMRLQDIARVLDVPAKTLEELNPSLRYKLRGPQGALRRDPLRNRLKVPSVSATHSARQSPAQCQSDSGGSTPEDSPSRTHCNG
jgi:membrane-bound lytic murein transglycosylase D